MKYAIITNPGAGHMTIDQKRSMLTPASALLNAEIHGLDTLAPEELRQCARELASQCDVLVVAGGDGTFSDIINAVDTTDIPTAYLPLGTGNAIAYALGYRGRIIDIARRIRDSGIRTYDLIDCDHRRRGFTASLGISGTILRLREQFKRKGITGFRAYFMAAFSAYFGGYRRTSVEIVLDHAAFRISELLILMVVKLPYYGFRMKVVPEARFDDGQLHILCVNSGLFMASLGALSAFTIGNRIGKYHTSRNLTLTAEQPLFLQIDGNDAWAAESFSFSILPKALKMKC